MGKIAFVFSGQGDQYPGMGKELCASYPAAKRVFDMCDSIRKGTSEQCFTGSEEELKSTANTQPCLFAVELATAAVLEENGIIPDAVAGFSLGEVVACTYAGYVDRDTGFGLVCKRGELMQSAAEKHDTSMAAVVKLDEATVRELCSKYTAVYPVNFNCPGQISVAGLSSEMTDFAADVKAAGGRAIPLKVKGGFHSPFMSQAAESFAAELAGVGFKSPRMTLYSNLTAIAYGNDVAGQLSAQICNPVKWEALIRNMINDGYDTFIEIGVGKTLTNMIGKINADVKRFSACDMENVISEVGKC